MTSAQTGGVGVAQNLTKTDMGEGGGQPGSDIIFRSPKTFNFNGQFTPFSPTEDKGLEKSLEKSVSSVQVSSLSGQVHFLPAHYPASMLNSHPEFMHHFIDRGRGVNQNMMSKIQGGSRKYDKY